MLTSPPPPLCCLENERSTAIAEKEEKIDATGIIGLQVHGGGKTKVMYKDITIEELKK